MEVVNELLVAYAGYVPVVMVLTQVAKDWVSSKQARVASLVLGVLLVLSDSGFSVMSLAQGVVLGAMASGSWDGVKQLLGK